MKSTDELLGRIKDLEDQLEEATQIIEAIKAGEVDAFAMIQNDKPQVFTLESGDFAYRILVENFNEGALNLSEDGLIVYTNTYFHELLHLPYEKVISNSLFDFIHPHSKEAFDKLFRLGIEGQAKGEINMVAGDTMIPVYVSLTSLQPTLPTIGVIVTDLTDKKKHAELLEQKSNELIRMNKELESFAYISSHDLQEPLRKIQTFTSLILEKEFDKLSENGKEQFKRMQYAARRMQTLINDLIAYSKVSIKDRKYEIINLKQIIEEVKEDLQEEIKEKHAVIETGELGEVKIIPFQFLQLMHNLIGNSLKFSNGVKQPKINITCEIVIGAEFNKEHLRPEKKYSHIQLSDNGIGFDPEYKHRIFEVFQRLHGRAEYEGTGIGLSIVKKIIENHDGQISANSKPNEGAVFDIYIPAV